MAPKLKEESARQRREQILEAAYELFATRGYQRTTMRRLASKMGMTTGVLYTYFASKDEIIQALAERSRKSSSQLLEVLSKEETSREALRSLLSMFADHWDREPAQRGARANINLLSEATRRESIQREAAQLYSNTGRIFKRLAKDASERGELEADVDPDAVGDFLNALFLGMQVEQILVGEKSPGDHIAAISKVLLGHIWRTGKG